MKQVFRLITNKFLLTGTAFAVWMIYFDSNNLTVQSARKMEVYELDRNIGYLNSEIARLEQELVDLKVNPERLEEYARERYKMKRDNEDVFIIEH